MKKREKMKLEKEDEEEFEMLLGEIPNATSLPQHLHYHQHHQHRHVQKHENRHEEEYRHLNDSHVHGSSPRKAIHGMCNDDYDASCHGRVCVSPITGVSLWSESSTSSSLSPNGSPPPLPVDYQIPAAKTHYPNGFSNLKESGLPDSPLRKNGVGRMTTMDELSLPRKPHYSNVHWVSQELEQTDSLVGNNFNGSVGDELGLSEKLYRLRVGDTKEDTMAFNRQAAPIGCSIDPCGFAVGGQTPVGSNCGNVVMNSPFEDCRNGFCNDYGGFQCSSMPNSAFLDEERRLSRLKLLQQHRMGNLSGLCFSSHRLGSPYPHMDNCMESMNFPLKQSMEHSSDETLSAMLLPNEATFGRNCYQRGFQIPNTLPAVNRASIADAFVCPQQNGYGSSGDWRGLNSLSSSHLAAPNPPLAIGNPLHYNLPMYNGRVRAHQHSCSPRSALTKGAHNIEAFSCEDSFIIQGKDLNFVRNDGCNLSKERKLSSYIDMSRGHFSEKNSELAESGHSPRLHCTSLLPPKYSSLQEVEGYIYYMAKDQHGCRFLQRKFDEGTEEDIQTIFNEIIDHVVELMMNPFGNYLMQKLLDVCTEEQRLQILLVVTGEPGKLVKISLNTHGTRAVQKLIETLKSRQQISLAITALEPGFLDLIKDLNGNHVVQRCLQCLSNEDNKFIFDAAAKYCVDIATHRHGCCVLQRCISHSTGVQREKLVVEISSNGLLLSQDAFGNYVVQYILELKIPSAIANLVSQFEGNYVQLSMQKFSSNVVEKCLNAFDEESRSRIIHELLSSSRFEQLLQDPFANYVVQSALLVSKGPLHASLVEAIRPYAALLRTSPYCKRIFSRTLLKK